MKEELWKSVAIGEFGRESGSSDKAPQPFQISHVVPPPFFFI